MQTLSRRSFLAASAAILASGSAAGPEPADDGAEKVLYKTVDGVALYLHLFRPKAGPADTPRPAIVFFFGGGWQGGNPSQFYEHCKHFASRGIMAMAAEYRVKSRHGTSPIECVKDGKSAIRWIRQHAKELGVDPANVVAGGGSAGGHVAACTGVVSGFDETGEDTAVSSQPAALVLFNPVLDTTGERWSKHFLGKAEALSPLHNVRAGLPPTIIFHGTADTTVPFDDAKRFDQRMREAGNACTLVPFEGKGHGFFNYKKDPAVCADTLRRTDDFLVSLAILKAKADT